jgi:hypothetical protein
MLRPWLHSDWVHDLTKWCARYTAGIDNLNGIIKDGISSRKQQHKEMISSGEDIRIENIRNTFLMDILILNDGLSTDDILGEISSIAGVGAVRPLPAVLLWHSCANIRISRTRYWRKRRTYIGRISNGQ